MGCIRLVRTYVVVEVLAIGGGDDDAGADTEVTKSLTLVTLKGVALKERLHDVEDLILLDALAI